MQRLCRTAAEQVGNGTDLTLLLGSPALAGALERALSVVNIDPAGLPAALTVLPQRPDVILNGLALIINEQWVRELRGPRPTPPRPPRYPRVVKHGSTSDNGWLPYVPVAAVAVEARSEMGVRVNCGRWKISRITPVSVSATIV